ncbi:ferrous iron transport protein B [Chitiniphilus shinanonensis]|uniref:Ferrous iron transport protein B n=1 Tax=Chitiniphilus shinanonensis TaxID=553088 RepID=A0ABQ6BW78_9NEIS|nr:Fe(2+) transporter permease subunit FeoB [Chitiniphilus shinanonensis]GLS06203.1 ferrous iron transport protein B [Chitiniphilus shinanonensis]
MNGKPLVVALLGNPNCGKTTLFNALTGARQRVGNWPGVTVERKSGQLRHGGREIEVIDLPGIYTLDSLGDDSSLDEAIARDYVLSREADVVVNILDAANLERNLYLTTQLLEMDVPVLIALNMTDMADDKGIVIDLDALARETGCPVIPMVAARNKGVGALKDALLQADALQPSAARPAYPDTLTVAVDQLRAVLAQTPDAGWLALKALEGDALALRGLGPDLARQADALRQQVEADLGDELDIVTADARYAFIDRLGQAAVRRSGKLSRTMSDRIDQVVLNRVLGIPLFLLMMYLMFMFTINIGGAFIDFFDQAAGTLLVDGLGHLLGTLGAPQWLVVLLAQGIGGGIQTVATFIPVIGCLFIFLSILEDSGYMARAAFVMDRFMRAIGLPGKSFVPLIVGFGCNVPAVMATRTLESPRDRLMTMAMTPFMSCGARLPVYALFAVAFFPNGGQNIVFLLYLIGIGAAVLTGLALKRTLLPGENTPFIMELPSYHLPALKGVLIHAWSRLRSFIFKAGRIIVPMVLVLNVLNATGMDGSFGHEDTQDSVLSHIGKSIAPAFSPLGVSQDNWPAAVGIFTGVLAKEAVVGTLNSLYDQLDAAAAPAAAAEETPFDVSAGLKGALATIPANLGDVAGKLLDPLGMKLGETHDTATAAAEQEVSVETFGAMARLFATPAAAFAYMLLVLLYFPCVAVLGAVNREAGLRWALFMAAWASGFGYGVAVLFYQLATFGAHPASSLAWIVGILACAALALGVMHRHGQRQRSALLAGIRLGEVA